MRMPPLQTARLTIRPFAIEDLEDIHHILDLELRDAEFGSERPKTLEERRHWLQWTVLGYEELARLFQPPYGDRGVVLTSTNQLIGACGFVPCLDAFGRLPSLGSSRAPARLTSTEFGLYYAVAPAHQRRGYATEAARAMIDYAFGVLHLRRVIATTTRDNGRSIGVMRKLGMRVVENPHPEPPWLQVVGVLENESRSG